MAESQTRQTLTITRRFAAPRERVWTAWTRPELLVRWLGPHDWPAVSFEADLRPNGRWHAVLRSKSGEELEQGGRYLEIDPPHCLRFTFQWESDNHEDGPGVQTEVSVELIEDGPSTTLMKFEQRGLVNDESARGHEGGWQQTFDRLTAWIESEVIG